MLSSKNASRSRDLKDDDFDCQQVTVKFREHADIEDSVITAIASRPLWQYLCYRSHHDDTLLIVVDVAITCLSLKRVSELQGTLPE